MIAELLGLWVMLESNAHLKQRTIRTTRIVIACGMAKYENDVSVAPVFERADQKMYENKSDLKGGRLT